MRGSGLALAGALLFGAVTGLAKLLLGSAGPATAGALTFLGAGLVGMLAMPLSHAPRPAARCRKGYPIFFAASILGAVAAPLLLMIGLQHTASTLASILTNIEGIATAGLAWLLFGERSDARSVAGIIIILCGVVCFTLANGMVGMGGDGWLLVVAAYLCWAVDVNLMRCVSGIPPEKATALRGISGAVVMGGIACLWRESLPDAITVASGVAIGALGFGISFMLMLKALPLIGAAKTGAMFACAPVFGYLFSSLVDRGAAGATAMQWLALAFIVAGILVSGSAAFASERSGAARHSAEGGAG